MGAERRVLRRLTALGAASAVVHAGAPPVAGWLGVEALAAHVAVVAALLALQVLAVRLVARARDDGRAVLAVVLGFGLLFRLLALPTPVYLSSDVYRYLWDGRVQLAGISPYRHPPAAPELAALRDAEIHPSINRPWARTVYPPAAQWLFALAGALAPGSLPGWRALLLAVDAAAVALLLAVLRRLGHPRSLALVYAWSPLVVFEGVQAGHVDLAVVPLVLLAAWWRMDGRSLPAGVALGLATLVKLYPAALALAWWRRGDVAFPAAVGATVALGYAPYVALHGAGALGFLPEYLRSAEDHNIGLRALLTVPFGLTGETARAVAMAGLFGAMLASLVAIARRHAAGGARTWEAGALAAGAYLLLVPTSMHPWYVVWIVPFLATTLSPAWLYFSGAVSVSYVKYLVEPAPFPWWAWVAEYVPLFGLLAHAGVQALARRTPAAAGAA